LLCFGLLLTINSAFRALDGEGHNALVAGLAAGCFISGAFLIKIK
jgi:hypothetical protein